MTIKLVPCDVSPQVHIFKLNVSASKGIFMPVTNDDAVANANVYVRDRDLAYGPPSKRCRTQHSYDVPVTNDDAVANANVYVRDRDLAYGPPSKRCRTQHSYDVTIRAEVGKYTYSDG